MYYLRLSSIFLFIFFSSYHFLQADTYSTTIIPPNAPNAVQEVKIEHDKEPEEETQEDLFRKAKDYQRAFKILKQEKPGSSIYMIVSGQSIDHLSEFRIMPQGTLVMLTIRTSRGFQTRVINTADISEIGQR